MVLEQLDIRSILVWFLLSSILGLELGTFMGMGPIMELGLGLGRPTLGRSSLGRPLGRTLGISPAKLLRSLSSEHYTHYFRRYWFRTLYHRRVKLSQWGKLITKYHKFGVRIAPGLSPAARHAVGFRLFKRQLRHSRSFRLDCPIIYIFRPIHSSFQFPHKLVERHLPQQLLK